MPKKPGSKRSMPSMKPPQRLAILPGASGSGSKNASMSQRSAGTSRMASTPSHRAERRVGLLGIVGAGPGSDSRCRRWQWLRYRRAPSARAAPALLPGPGRPSSMVTATFLAWGWGRGSCLARCCGRWRARLRELAVAFQLNGWTHGRKPVGSTHSQPLRKAGVPQPGSQSRSPTTL